MEEAEDRPPGRAVCVPASWLSNSVAVLCCFYILLFNSAVNHFSSATSRRLETDWESFTDPQWLFFPLLRLTRTGGDPAFRGLEKQQTQGRENSEMWMKSWKRKLHSERKLYSEIRCMYTVQAKSCLAYETRCCARREFIFSLRDTGSWAPTYSTNILGVWVSANFVSPDICVFVKLSILKPHDCCTAVSIYL